MKRKKPNSLRDRRKKKKRERRKKSNGSWKKTGKIIGRNVPFFYFFIFWEGVPIEFGPCSSRFNWIAVGRDEAVNEFAPVFLPPLQIRPPIGLVSWCPLSSNLIRSSIFLLFVVCCETDNVFSGCFF